MIVLFSEFFFLRFLFVLRCKGEDSGMEINENNSEEREDEEV